jgi:septal ring factor EnvC (AmiA/AmiB activator)
VNVVEQQTMLKEILKALDLHASDFRSQTAALNEKIETMDKKVEALDKKLEAMNGEFKRKFAEMDERFNRLETKIDSLRIELIETQETVDFHSAKIAQHDRKIRKLSQQQ